MPKPQQVLVITPPSEIKFQGPFTQSVTRHLKVTNPSEKIVLFKIKTTAPKRYFVRPSSGVLRHQEFVEVAICLRPFDYDPNDKTKHKFMVQSMLVPDGIDIESGGIDTSSFWKDVRADEIMDTKLKCTFEMPQSGLEPSYEVEQEVYASSDIGTSKVYLRALEDDEESKVSVDATASEALRLEGEELRLREENKKLMDQLLELREDGDEVLEQEVIESSKPSSYMFLSCIGIAVVVCLLGIVVGKFFA